MVKKSKEQFEVPGSLMAQTLALAKGHDPVELDRATGISFYWIRKFCDGTIKNPSVNRVQKLYEYLSNKTLPI